MQRIRTLSSQLADPNKQAGTFSKSPNDIVIVCAVRTAICRAKKGGFANCHPEELLSAALKGILDRTKIDPKLVQDICVGNVLPPGGGATLARMAAFHAGQCSSGLQAVANIAAAIHEGWIDIGIGAGVESMSMHYEPANLMPNAAPSIQSNKAAASCLLPMGVTAENVSAMFNISRSKQDAFSLESHKRAALAQSQGLFKNEIIPMKVKKEDGSEVIIDQDDGIRANASLEALAKLKPSFKENGCITPGNASQVSDAAAGVLLMRRSQAEDLNLPIMGRFLGFATAGVPPEIMGVGPAYAIPKVLNQVGLSINEISVIELNEAFAAIAIYSIEKLGLDPRKVNPVGGAVALGHPLGCTGARQVATILNQLHRNKQRYGLISMCIGTGMGAAAVIENEHL